MVKTWVLTPSSLSVAVVGAGSDGFVGRKWTISAPHNSVQLAISLLRSIFSFFLLFFFRNKYKSYRLIVDIFSLF